IITNVGIEKLPEKIYQVKDTGIEIFENLEVIEAVPDSEGLIKKIICKNTKPESEETVEIKEFELSCLFILSHISSNSIFKKAGVELDDMGNIKVNDDQKTNLKGVYAAGDCTGGLFQIVFATAEGARAGINACKYLRHLKKE
ncbi:MAG: NAD(P)/FAD-dependent oxidoreductase, partial [Promethearchaeota archaeon]